MAGTGMLMTADELLGYEVPGKRTELRRGHLLVHEPPGFEHADIVVRISTALAIHVRACTPSLGRVVAGDPGFILERDPDTVRAPDVAFVRRDRLPPGPVRGFAEFIPDLAVEVRSPSDRTGELLVKVGDWLNAGVALLWVIDPVRRCAQVYRPDGLVTILGESETLMGEPVLPGFTLALSTLFDDDVSTRNTGVEEHG